MILLTHPTGNQNVRQAALALEEAGLLEEFWTSIAWKQSNAMEAILPASLVRELRRRSFPEEIVGKVHTFPWHEAARLASGRLRLPPAIRQHFSVDAIYRHLDQRVTRRLGHRQFAGVYAYEDGARETFYEAKRTGIKTIYELPTIYWRTVWRIAQEETDRLPDWSGTISALKDDEAKLRRKDEELASADAIIVASRFVADALLEAPFPIAQPIVIPYGCETSPVSGNDVRPKTSEKGSALRALFVGHLGQLKGIHELFRATETLGARVRLTVVGQRVGECAVRDQHLQRYRWIPTLPHAEVLQLMREHDVLVFPSLLEGFGLVITEALSQGLPVITTDHTCGSDILSEGMDGFVVPIRDWEKIAERLELLDRDRALLAQMKVNAQATAAQRPWARYRQKLAETARTILQATPVSR